MKTLPLVLCGFSLSFLTGCGSVLSCVEKDLDKLPRGQMKGLVITHASNLGTLTTSIGKAIGDDLSVTVEGVVIDSQSLWTGKNTFSVESWHRIRNGENSTKAGKDDRPTARGDPAKAF